MINALTFDVEDWFNSKIEFSKWQFQKIRVEEDVYKILGMLRRNNTKATFFVLGWVAEKFPDLIENIAFEGHEIASHGYKHELVHKQTVHEFEQDLVKSLDLLKEITGQRIIGYRAPGFSINKKSIWALSILERNGIKYDSSIMPTKDGIRDAPKSIHATNNGIMEFPVSTTRFMGFDILFGEGSKMKKYQYWLTRKALQNINNPFMIQCNSYDKDSSHKIKQLLHDFEFSTARNVLFEE